MGFWKDVAMDMHYGHMSKETAIKVNADLCNSKTEEEHEDAWEQYKKELAKARANAELDTMP